jgi:NAD(P)-dependent dehydrogenase (short-subunit alcohol dehydrogenase family)
MSDALPESLIPREADEPTTLETRPRIDASNTRSNRLSNRIAVITDGATGVGQAVALAFAREGATVVFSWLNEQDAAAETVARIDDEGGISLSVPGDIGNPDFATELVRQAVAEFGRIDIVVNTATEQHACETFEDIDHNQVERIFRTNILGQFWLTKAALPHMADGTCIINTGAARTDRSDAMFVDYAASKAAVIGFTRSLSMHLVKRGIRVNAVVPGAQVDETGPSYVFLASADAASMTGQVLHAHGGTSVT